MDKMKQRMLRIHSAYKMNLREKNNDNQWTENSFLCTGICKERI